MVGGFAKDVTKRYAKAYYSKTWRNRIESQSDGEKWWSRIMKFLDRMEPLVQPLLKTHLTCRTVINWNKLIWQIIYSKSLFQRKLMIFDIIRSTFSNDI